MSIESLATAARAAGFAMATSEDSFVPGKAGDPLRRPYNVPTVKPVETAQREPAAAGRWLREMSSLLRR